MTIVNFYTQVPSITQMVSDLNNDELIVFTYDTTSGGRAFNDQVEALVNFSIYTNHENTILKWSGDDYFVMHRSSFEFTDVRETLRKLALNWFNAGKPNQVKHI